VQWVRLGFTVGWGVDSRRGLSWLRVLLAGSIAAFCSFAFIYLAVYGYVISYPIVGRGEVGREQLDGAIRFIGSWGAEAAFLLLTLLAASWVARKAGAAPMIFGVAVGLCAAVSHQMTVLFLYPPVLPNELALYLVLGIAAGCLGGLEGRGALGGHEALHCASREISRAQDRRDIAAAVGRCLAGFDLGAVALRGLTEGVDAGGSPRNTSELQTFWTPDEGETRPAMGAWFVDEEVAALTRPVSRAAKVMRSGDLSEPVRATCRRKGYRTVLFVPLFVRDEAPVGLLVAFFRSRRVSRGAMGRCLNIGSQVALALENLRLVEEAQRAGRQAGALRERQRLSREIHDTLAQGFTSILMSLTAAEMARPQAESDPMRRHLESSRRTARECLAEARRLVWALRPGALDRHSLPTALDSLARGWSAEANVEARVVVTGSQRRLLPEVEAVLLRAAQEALSNVRKHACASRVLLTLSFMDESVALDIRDDGAGFDPARLVQVGEDRSDGGGFGLVAMRERVEELGGTLSVESTPGKGTTLAAELPITASFAEEPSEEESEARVPRAARATR
jgi:signal transduction histidine kinase